MVFIPLFYIDEYEALPERFNILWYGQVFEIFSHILATTNLGIYVKFGSYVEMQTKVMAKKHEDTVTWTVL